MATKKVTKVQSSKVVEMPEMPVVEEKIVERKENKKQEFLMTSGWILLLVGGLAHMLPVQMEPLLKWSMWNVSVQMAVGVLSVIVALYYLLGE